MQKRRKDYPRRLSRALPRLLQKQPEAKRAFRLVELWRGWDDIVGPEAADLARPLGHRKHVLLLGVEDSSSLQELMFYTPQILYNANEFLGETYFEKVSAELIRDRKGVDKVRLLMPITPPLQLRRPASLGGLAGSMAPESSVRGAYEAYLRLFAEEPEEELS